MLKDLYGAETLDERWMYVIATGIVVGLILGIFMRRESQKRQPVRGGMGAEFFHYLAASGISGLVPAIFIALFSELNFLRIVGTGLIFQAITLSMLVMYSVFESQAPPVEEKFIRELD